MSKTLQKHHRARVGEAIFQAARKLRTTPLQADARLPWTPVPKAAPRKLDKTTRKRFVSKDQVVITVRLGSGLHQRLTEAAADKSPQNSLNREILERLELSFTYGDDWAEVRRYLAMLADAAITKYEYLKKRTKHRTHHETLRDQ